MGDLETAIAAAKAGDQPEPVKRGTMTDQPGTFTVQPESWRPRPGDQVRVTLTERSAADPRVVEGEVEQVYLRQGDWPYIDVSGSYVALENCGVDAVIERI